MKRQPAVLVFLALAAMTPLSAAADFVPPLRPGERLSYVISWGPFRKAASVEITAAEETLGGVRVLRVTTKGATAGAARVLYAFDGSAEALMDAGTGRLLSITNRTGAGGKRAETRLVADHEKGEATYTDSAKPEAKTIALPADEPLLDFITALIQTRGRPLPPGGSRELSVIFDDDLYALTISAVCRQILMTPEGPRETVLVQPAMRGKPRGLFRRGGHIKVWVSDDALRLPLRFEIKLKYGTAIGTLSEAHLETAPAG
ncbi:MAG: DUF3108 domain-containing protein [Opitutaceae bacterium]|jgi:hypothetical protein|nr:DUF3108 domain-containing protein [Opitutaceae bacterium]